MSNTFYFGYFIILNKKGVLNNNNNMRNLFCSKPNCCIIYKFKKTYDLYEVEL